MDLVEEIKKEYAGWDMMFIYNGRIEQFLNERKAFIDEDNFKKLKDYFLVERKLYRSVFRIWEKENELLLKNKKGVVTAAVGFLLEEEMKELLLIRRYSRKTVKSYIGSVRITNLWLQKNLSMNIEQATEEDLKDYFLYLTNTKKVSVSSIRMRRFAIEFYFQEVLMKELRLSFAYNLKKPNSLPTIFTKQEVVRILNSCTNLKHKMILSLLYSSGLRLSEVIHLKVKDIDTKEGTVRVRMGKGNSDRITVLSEKILSDLKVFIENRKPENILFPSNQSKEFGKDSYLSTRTVEHVFASALKKSGVRKHGTPHDFRHSFATHLLETGTDIHFIQKLLGHKNVSTTTIYTKLANPKIAGVRSPL